MWKLVGREYASCSIVTVYNCNSSAESERRLLLPASADIRETHQPTSLALKRAVLSFLLVPPSPQPLTFLCSASSQVSFHAYTEILQRLATLLALTALTTQLEQHNKYSLTKLEQHSKSICMIYALSCNPIETLRQRFFFELTCNVNNPYFLGS